MIFRQTINKTVFKNIIESETFTMNRPINQWLLIRSSNRTTDSEEKI